MSMKRQREINKRQQAKQMLEDPAWREAIGQALGVEIGWKDDLKNEAIVAVLTPTHRGLEEMTRDAMARMLNYSKHFCKVFTQPIMGSSLVSWVRNDMLAALLVSGKPFTHVLWIDDDMDFEPDVLVRMLAHDADVVGAVYTVRSDPPRPNVHLMNRATGEARRVLDFDQPGVVVDDNGLMRARSEEDTLTCGTGLMLVKREVVEAVGQFYVDCAYERQLWNLTDEQVAAKVAYRRERVEKTKNAYWFQLLPRFNGYAETGEDTSFCLKSALCGKTVVVDTKLRPQHVGKYTYGWDDYLPFQREEIEKARRNGSYF